MLNVPVVRPSQFDDNIPVRGAPMVEHTPAVLDAIFQHRSASLPRIDADGASTSDSAENGPVASAVAKTIA